MSLISEDADPSENLATARNAVARLANRVTFNRFELNRILNLYRRMVADGEWRDYAIDFLRDRAVFSVFRRASEVPISRIEEVRGLRGAGNLQRDLGDRVESAPRPRTRPRAAGDRPQAGAGCSYARPVNPEAAF